jgi:hypothetical protein
MSGSTGGGEAMNKYRKALTDPMKLPPIMMMVLTVICSVAGEFIAASIFSAATFITITLAVGFERIQLEIAWQTDLAAQRRQG